MKNILGLVVAIIMVISCFCPWVESSVTGSAGGYSSSFSSGGMTGIMLGYGMFGVILGVVGAVLAWIGFKFALVVGVVGLLDGIALIVGWGSTGTSYSGSGYSGSVSVDPLWGLFLFVGASLIYTLVTIKQLKANQSS